ncbi:hypothetical protein [Nocardia sp. NPDC051833]|uniref:hypothetical protein n=1 Tax=Nocardia sp. NPDC051833 TaxID=3155674 RepID=UPI0034388FB4
MTDIWSDVREFNAACGVRLRPTPGWVPDGDLALAMQLIAEERDELLFALSSRDMVAAADGIADSMYVRVGLLLRLGLARTYIHDLLLVHPKEPPSWVAFDATHTMVYLGDELEEIDDRIAVAITERRLMDIDVEAHRALYHLHAIAALLHIPLEAVWAEVQRSNMAKVVDGKVRRRVDGKIEKPTGWTPPDIAGVLGLGAVEDAA